MNIRLRPRHGMAGVLLLAQSGCATALLSQKISRDHKNPYVHHVDEDRVYDVNQAGKNERGDILIWYTGAHGPYYATKSYCMRLTAKTLQSGSREEASAKTDSDPHIIFQRVRRNATREAAPPGPGSDHISIPVLNVPRMSELNIEEIATHGSKRNGGLIVLFSPDLKYRSSSGKPRGKGPLSTGVGVLRLSECPGEPSRLIVPTIPMKSTHDLSGVGYRCLYPVTIVWDVATFPLQALAAVWILQDSSGGWLF